mmetsp:Transcript_5095/g.15561  ORF Transcript_5095/g.15561 Transcript_5095/m.15561 type:complete len:255 (+) Transcript_5095:674-1438(+)
MLAHVRQRGHARRLGGRGVLSGADIHCPPAQLDALLQPQLELERHLGALQPRPVLRAPSQRGCKVTVRLKPLQRRSRALERRAVHQVLQPGLARERLCSLVAALAVHVLRQQAVQAPQRLRALRVGASCAGAGRGARRVLRRARQEVRHARLHARQLRLLAAAQFLHLAHDRPEALGRLCCRLAGAGRARGERRGRLAGDRELPLHQLGLRARQTLQLLHGHAQQRALDLHRLLERRLRAAHASLPRHNSTHTH